MTHRTFAYASGALGLCFLAAIVFAILTGKWVALAPALLGLFALWLGSRLSGSREQ